MIKKQLLKCFGCGGKGVLTFSHSYQYEKNNINMWASIFIETCKKCNTFIKVDTKIVNIKDYINKNQLQKQKGLYDDERKQ